MLTIVDQVLAIDSNFPALVYSIRSRVRIGLGLKKLFEDGVVKREENMQPTLEGFKWVSFGTKMDGIERVGLSVENGVFGCSNGCGAEMVVGLGAKMRDDIEAAAMNLVAGEKLSDVYLEIAAR
ncbi:hypothetical protein Tco_1278077, partial [Tanacetum coccineum]